MTETKKTNKGKIPLILGGVVIVGLIVKLVFFGQDFRYAGTLEATKIDLSAQVPASIQTVSVREGDHVQAGQKLIDLACEDLRVAADLAHSNYDRNLRLFKSGTASQETMDQMKNRRDDADIRVAWCEIKSPVNGTILNRYHEPGEWMMIGTKMLTLANIRDIWAYIYVPQPQVANLKPGMKLTAHLPELNDRAFEGTILKINSEAEFTPKNVQTRSERERLVYGVKVSFLGANEDEVLKPGMTVEVELPKL
jgi:HlyD family secretion protein